MYTDVVYEVLHPFHLWAQRAAVCALVLAAASVGLLARSRRLSPRWWLGIGILTACLLAVVFGARSREAASDLRPHAVACYVAPLADCGISAVWIVQAQERVAQLGIVLLAGTGLCLGVTAVALLRAWRRRGAGASGREHPPAIVPARVIALALAIFVAGCGTYLTANSTARWIETAYLADITRAGDGIGQIPLIEAIMGTLFGAVVLVASLIAVIVFTPPREEKADVAPVAGSSRVE